MRAGRYYVRRRVPALIRAAVRRREIWLSLDTDSPRVALQRWPQAAAEIERRFDEARLAMDRESGLLVAKLWRSPGSEAVRPPEEPVQSPGLTLADAYERYINDPTHSWSDSTREAYESTRKMATAIIGAAMPVSAISRAHARDFMEVLRHLPRNASKRFPKLTPREAAERARRSGDGGLISAAHANVYISSFSTFLNWAVNEEMLPRNPIRGLRLPDDVAKRDKRHPFTPDQLRALFSAPLYRGCVDGHRGYAKPGPFRPLNARYWVPIIGLHTGMRLNEICQLDVTDVRTINGVHCIVVTAASLVGSTDKRLKTGASERAMPLHPHLLMLGLPGFAEQQMRSGQTKLFHDIDPGSKGIRAVAFSKWFTQFQRSVGAAKARTSFHSFRHNFRDALRIARIDHDVAMALGGWTMSASSKSSVSDNYGSGYPISVLKDAVDRLSFVDIELSHIMR